MRAITLDKVASVTLNCGLRKDVRVGDDFRCREGDVIAVRVLTDKAQYNTLELTTGRMSPLRAGDVIAGALGHRRALVGYAGRIPRSLSVGQTMNILNLGGVLGECTSAAPSVGPPFEVEVLGQVLDFPFVASRKAVPANISDGCAALDETLDLKGVPVVAMVGSCMNSGKTEACLALINEFGRMGKKVVGGKATGVSLRRDVLAMEDAGASRTMVFTDLGVVTTSAANAAPLARTILNRLAEEKPDVIVLELGDGLIGEYGVDAILADASLRSGFRSIVLAANDPVAAWGGVQILKDRYGLRPDAVTGPATDNESGTSLIERETGVLAVNARSHHAELAHSLMSGMEATVVN